MKGAAPLRRHVILLACIFVVLYPVDLYGLTPPLSGRSGEAAVGENRGGGGDPITGHIGGAAKRTGKEASKR